MIAELGRKIGEVESLAARFPEHEGRIRNELDDHWARHEALGTELRRDMRDLADLFRGHTHDAPPPAEEKLSEALDNPVQTIEHALSTPEAPPADEVQAPPQAPEARVYRSRLFRDR